MTNNTPDTQLEISIHAPREGCDAARQCLGALAGISIHAPREGCDFTATEPPGGTVGFQSTHPVRGATSRLVTSAISRIFQSTHPVRGATWT